MLHPPLTQTAFKAFVVLSALALIPLVWVWMEYVTRLPADLVSYRLWGTKHFLETCWPFALAFLTCAVLSVRWWWRMPRWYTAFAVYIALAGICGAPGMALLLLISSLVV